MFIIVIIIIIIIIIIMTRSFGSQWVERVVQAGQERVVCGMVGIPELGPGGEHPLPMDKTNESIQQNTCTNDDKKSKTVCPSSCYFLSIHGLYSCKIPPRSFLPFCRFDCEGLDKSRGRSHWWEIKHGRVPAR